MWSLVIVTVLFKFSSSQHLPNNQHIITEFIKVSSPAITNNLCKNLGSSIQDTALAQFRTNSARVPIFGSISEPIVQELYSCMSCPYCSKYNVNRNGYTKSLIPNSDLPKILNSANVVKILNQDQVRQLRGLEYPVVNNVRENYLNVIKPGFNSGVVNVGNDLLNSALKMASALSNSMISKSNAALKANAPNVKGKYRELVTAVRTIPCNCGCRKQILV